MMTRFLFFILSTVDLQITQRRSAQKLFDLLKRDFLSWQANDLTRAELENEDLENGHVKKRRLQTVQAMQTV